MKFNRRAMLSSSLFAILSALSGCGGKSEDPASGNDRPNFLVIVVDDMGMADIGSFGGEIETPNLDRLAYGGVRLTNFHTSPVCSATRAMLLTGVDNHKAGFGNLAEELAPNQQGQPGHEGQLNDRVVTIASLLKDEGYRTYVTGKWHLGKSVEASPWARGFERSFTMLSGGASHFPDMRPAYHPDPDGKAPYRRDRAMVETLPDNFQYSTQFYVDEMLDYFSADAASRDPFFAYLAFTAPHWPLQAPQKTIAKYHGAYDSGYDTLRTARLARQKTLGIIPTETNGNARPPHAPEWKTLSEEERKIQSRAMEIYAAMIDEIDAHVGRLIAKLEKNGDLENTVVMFISDNGAEGHDLDETWPGDLFPDIRKNIDERHDFSLDNMGAPNSYVLYGPGWARAGAPAFRLHKGFPTEGGTRVSAFIRYGEFLKGEISDRFFTVKDLAPTILDLAQINHPAPAYRDHSIEPMSGFTMRPALTDRQTLHEKTNRIEGGEILGKYMVRKGQWKLVHMPPPHGADRWKLYNLETDIAELNDLSSDRPDLVRELAQEWERYAEENGVILPDWVSGY